MSETQGPEVVNYDRNEWNICCTDCGTEVSSSKGSHALPNGLRVHGWSCSACNNVFPGTCHGPDARSFIDNIVGVEIEFRDGSTRYVPAIKSTVPDSLETTSEADNETSETKNWPGILICSRCRQYVDADQDAEETACEHSWGDARDISDLDDETWAKIRHDSYIRELERDEPRGSRAMLVSNLTSLMMDLVWADVLPEDYDDREGLDRLLVTEAGT